MISIIKASGKKIPADALQEISSSIMENIKDSDALALTATEQKTIASNGPVKGYAKAKTYWDNVAKKMPKAEAIKDKKAVFLAAAAQHISKLKAKPLAIDKLLAVKLATLVSSKERQGNRMKNVMVAKQLGLTLIPMTEAQIKAYTQTDKLKFTDDKGKKHDWIINTGDAPMDQPRAVSPTTVAGKYVILLRNGAVLSLSPAEAKQKYGISK